MDQRWRDPGPRLPLRRLQGLNPSVEVINSAITGGTASGGNMKAVLQTRVMGGDPPESFQIHLGHELLDSYVAAGKMEPLDFLYNDEGYAKVFPKGLIDIASARASRTRCRSTSTAPTSSGTTSRCSRTSARTRPRRPGTSSSLLGDKLKAKGVCRSRARRERARSRAPALRVDAPGQVLLRPRRLPRPLRRHDELERPEDEGHARVSSSSSSRTSTPTSRASAGATSTT